MSKIFHLGENFFPWNKQSNAGLVAVATPGAFKKAALLFDLIFPLYDDEDAWYSDWDTHIPSTFRTSGTWKVDKELRRRGNYGSSDEQRRISQLIFEDAYHHGWYLVPVASGLYDYDFLITRIIQGDQVSYIAAIENLPVINEEKLSCKGGRP